MKGKELGPETISISKEEWSNYCNKDVDVPTLHQWMKEKGIEFDSGDIEVILDGKLEKMRTSKDDFGTIEYNDED